MKRAGAKCGTEGPRDVACGASFQDFGGSLPVALGTLQRVVLKRCANKLWIRATLGFDATITRRKCTFSWPAHFTECQKKTKCRWITYTQTNRTTEQINYDGRRLLSKIKIKKSTSRDLMARRASCGVSTAGRTSLITVPRRWHPWEKSRSFFRHATRQNNLD